MRGRQNIIIVLEMIIIGLLMFLIDKLGFMPELDIPVWVIGIINNAYVTNIICSIASLILVYYGQLAYCKYRLKQDFRFDEALNDLYTANSEAKEMLSEWKNGDPVAFYEDQKTRMKMVHDMFLYPNNSIVWDSINTVFFLNINFKLLGIVNHIKNRLPTMDDWWKRLLKEEDSRKEDAIRSYLTDIRFLSEYFDELFEYFNFDLTLQQKTNEYITLDPIELMRLPINQQAKIFREARKKAKRALRNKR